MKMKPPSFATWVVGTILFIFFVCVFVFAPETLPEFKQRMLGLTAAFLAGIFAFLLAGDFAIVVESPSSPFGKILAKGTGGAAIFVLVLWWWWFSGAAPVAPEKVREVRGTVRYVLARDPFDRGDAGPLLPFPQDMFGSATKLSIAGKPHDGNWPPKIWSLSLPSEAGIHVTSSDVIGKDDSIRPTEIGPSQTPVRTYGRFTGSLGFPTTWKNSTLAAIVISYPTPEVEPWFDNLGRLAEKDGLANRAKEKDEFFKYYGGGSREAEEADIRVVPYELFAHLCIYIDAEFARHLKGRVARVNRGDSDPAGPYITVFRELAEDAGNAKLC
jgi:hypothetical protein